LDEIHEFGLTKNGILDVTFVVSLCIFELWSSISSKIIHSSRLLTNSAY